jgi:hypothetical protein
MLPVTAAARATPVKAMAVASLMQAAPATEPVHPTAASHTLPAAIRAEPPVMKAELRVTPATQAIEVKAAIAVT